MRSIVSSLGFVAGLTACCGLAVANPLTYACTFKDGSTRYNYMAQADQLIVDLETQSVDLRVARTMGTGEPINWLFTTRDSLTGPDKFLVHVDGDWITGAGFLAGTPH